MPRVSVNICCYNGERYVARTIRSVLAQTFPDFEIVVVNDGSRDATEAAILAFKDSRIRYFAQENRGLAETRNRAIALSQGEFVAMLDQDDLWEPDKLELQVKVMDGNPRVGVVYSGAYIIDDDGRVQGVGTTRWNRRGRIGAALLRGNCIICPTVMFRAAVLREAGAFRPDLGIGEEYDMYLRLSRLCEFDFVDKPLARYRMHAGNSSRDMAKNYRETVSILDGFAAAEPEADLRALAARQADLNRLRLAAVLQGQGRCAEAREVLEGCGGRAMRSLAGAPSWILGPMLASLRRVGMAKAG